MVDFALLYSTSSLMISAFLKLPFLRMLYCMCLCISVGVCGGREGGREGGIGY